MVHRLALFSYLVLLLIVSCAAEFNVLAPHTNNWAVLVCASRFWFNYRHIANVLYIYRIVKWLGIPDDHIILMLADDMACNGRNIFPGAVFNHYDHRLNVYGDDIEVDYRGSEVTVENFIRLLTNRLPVDTPRAKQLATDAGSNVLIYMTGHGGDNFLKFQDSEEINAHDLADAFDQMFEKGRYRELLFMIDTCQAATMYELIRSPNILALASSARKESSYSYHVDEKLGVPVLDRFTYSILQHMKNITMQSTSTMQDLFKSLSPDFLGSTPAFREDLFSKDLAHTRLVDFFGNVQAVSLLGSPIAIEATNHSPRLADEPQRPDPANVANVQSAEKADSYTLSKSPAQPSQEIDLVATIGIWLAGSILFLMSAQAIKI